jgi:hypothetical protein
MAYLDDIGGHSGGDTSSGGSPFSQAGLGAGIGLAGLATSLFGAEQGASAAKASAQASMNIAGLEDKVNQQRKLAMQISARRQGIEAIRNTQQLQSQATAAATGQGAQYGSGLQGGLAGLSGMGNFNLQGINQNLEIGNTIFGLDTQISQQKIAEAQAKSQEASASGISSIGGAIMKAAPTLAELAFTL